MRSSSGAKVKNLPERRRTAERNGFAREAPEAKPKEQSTK